MHIRGQSNMLAELGGAHWGLLPALLCLPWLISGRVGQVGPEAWFVLLASIMASYDLASLRIPNALTGLTALWGLLLGLGLGGLNGLGQGALGGLTAFGLMAVFFFLGAVGAGDVKALGALGTFLSPWGSLELFILTTLCGGGLAVVRLLAARRSLGAWGTLAHLHTGKSGLNMPYGLAICAAAWLMVFTGGVR